MTGQMTPPLTDVLSLSEAVAATSTSESTLRRKLRAGAFPGAVREGGAWRLPVVDLVAAELLAAPTEQVPATKSEALTRELAEQVAVQRERAARAEIEAQEVARLRAEVVELRTREAQRSAEIEQLREDKGRAEATVGELRREALAAAEAHAVEVDRLLLVVDRVTRLGAATDEAAPRVITHEVATEPDTEQETVAEPQDPPVEPRKSRRWWWRR